MKQENKMGQIKIDVSAVISAGSQIDAVESTVTNVKSSMTATRNRIDSKILGRNNIGTKSQNVIKQLGDIESRLKSIQSVVENGANQYHYTDVELKKQAVKFKQK